jgi:D-serine deaminase-like pyridoxal phosphate-dependent protein
MDFLPLPGTALDDLDSPALLVDLPVFERNLAKLHGYFQQRPAKVRPHIKAHKCPAIAHIQLGAQGTVGGVCAAKVGEAEVMVHAGVADVFIANEVVGRSKIQRLMQLARHARMSVCVDDPANVADLSEAAQAFNATLTVLVEVNIGLNRCGVQPGQPAVELARQVQKAPGLRFGGLMGYEGGMVIADFDERAVKTRQQVQKLLDTVETVERAGFPVEAVSSGGTATWNITGAMPGVTEVQAGGYVFMDLHFRYCADFDIALKMLCTVISRPSRHRAILDCGHKAIGLNYAATMEGMHGGFSGLPEVEGIPGATVHSLDAEHALVDLAGDAVSLRPGDKVVLLPQFGGAPVNQHDYYFGIRNGKLETVWEIASRGKVR